MLGPSTMNTSSEKSRFKSTFGKLEPAPRRYRPNNLGQSKNNTRKLISFFDSQRVDRM